MSKLEGNKVRRHMTDAERAKLAEKLDNDLDDFINSLEKRQYTEGWPEDRWEEEMEKHPFFMKKAPEPGAEIHPLLEGIQQLKYDPEENTAEELAVSYKEDGNFNFKHKNYRLAILSYSEGIQQNHENSDLKSTLYNNRAASHFFLKNYRSSLRDCQLALKLNPKYEKAAVRSAHCCYEMAHYVRCVELCDQILTDNSSSAIITLRQQAINAQKTKERDLRRREKAETQKRTNEQALMQQIISRGVKLDGSTSGLRHLEPHFPELLGSRVHLNEEGVLVWPVVLMYPEYKVTDFIQKFPENVTIMDQLYEMFDRESAAWDTELKYKVDNLNVYFEQLSGYKVHQVQLNSTLSEVLTHPNYIVRAGTPSLLVLVKDSVAEKHFLDSYKK